MSIDIFLKLDGISGESQDSKHKGEIEIESFSWGVSNAGSAAHGASGGGGAGKVSFQDFHFTTPVSAASPSIFRACATGKHIPKAVLTVRKAGERPVEFYKITLTDLLVSSYSQGGSSTDESNAPVDQFSFNFAKIEVNYQQQNSDGTVTTPPNAAASFDIVNNSAG